MGYFFLFFCGMVSGRWLLRVTGSFFLFFLSNGCEKVDIAHFNVENGLGSSIR